MRLGEPEDLLGVRLADFSSSIDRVCINQQDIRERNHQVQAMRKIYRRAHRVAVWPRPESSDSGQAVDLLYMLAKQRIRLPQFARSSSPFQTDIILKPY